MKTAHRKRRLMMLVLDAAMICMEVYALGISLGESGGKMFRYYTQDSNLLALILCIICAVHGIKGLRRGKQQPVWVRWLRYISACCLTLTLLMAGILLVSVEPGRTFHSFMLEGKYLFLHTLCPLLAIAQLFCQEGEGYGERHALLALFPTIVYGAVSLILNACGAYSGPYPFLRVLEQPGYATAVGCIAVLGVNYASARLLALATERQGKK